MPIPLLIATRNAHKVQEIRQILGDNFHYLTLNDFPDAPPVIEDAPTFAGNAQKKARTLAHWVAAQPKLSKEIFYILADDSGLEVDALNGAPGVHSARFAASDTGAEGNASDDANNAKLLRLLQNVLPEKRTARFRCVLACVSIQSNKTIMADGVCEGRITLSPAGTGGFGYDPLFIPDGHEKTFAQLGEETKNRLSHRAQALTELKKRRRISKKPFDYQTKV